MYKNFSNEDKDIAKELDKLYRRDVPIEFIKATAVKTVVALLRRTGYYKTAAIFERVMRETE